jgi:chemotaxis-related protein WspD
MSQQAPELHDCWNIIGVRGDHSCPELQKHVHCRNCPVFGSAAAELLDGELPPGYLHDWTRHFARPARIEEAGTESIVLFRIGEEWLALPTRIFEEVAEERPIHSLPAVRSSVVLGLVNVRGELLVCVSVAKLLGMDVTTVKRDDKRGVHRRLLVIRHEGSRTVFPADEVHGIQRFHERELKEPPATVARADVSFTRAVLNWRNHSVGLLDDQLLCYALNRSLSSATPT